MTRISEFALPVVILLSSLFLLDPRRDLFSQFVLGACNGARTSFELLPTLVMLMVGVKMFSACGAMEGLCALLSPVFEAFGIPRELLPIAIMRPISGSGSSALIAELFSSSGPDSLAGMSASVLMGSSDTILYTLSVYFSHTKTKRTGFALPVSFAVMIFCILFSCFITRVMI